MAAANVLPELDDDQKLNPEGHTTRIIEELRFPRLPFDFLKSINFKCFETPTSWSLRLEFRRVPTDGSVNCEVTIRRLDNAPVDMGTDFWMRVILPTPIPEYTLNFKAEGLFPNHQGTKVFQLVPNFVVTYSGGTPILFDMFFRIRRCHRDMLVAGPVLPERFRPPDFSLEMDIAELPQ